MKYFKKSMFLLLLAFFLFLFMGYTIPQKTKIQKTLFCLDNSQKKIIVTVSGTYSHYMLKNDCFHGTITIAGKKYTRNYILRDDFYGNFTDDVGQPTYEFLQFRQFDYISGSDGIHTFTSEWNPEWKKELEQKQKWIKKINQWNRLILREEGT